MTDQQIQHAKRIADLHAHLQQLKEGRAYIKPDSFVSIDEIDEQIATTEAMLAKELSEDQAEAAQAALANQLTG